MLIQGNSGTRAATGVLLGYTRVSTGRQHESGLGLEAQQALLRAAAQQRGMNLELSVEAASAKSLTGRPVLAAVLEQLRQGEAQGLVVAKLDRLSRSLPDFLSLQATAKREGWELVVLDLPCDTASPMGEAMGSMMATFAQLERRMISSRTAEAAAAAKARGARLGRPAVDPARTQALSLKCQQLRSEGFSFRAIAKHLNEANERTLRGGSEWRVSSVQALLRYQQLNLEAEEARRQQGTQNDD